MIPNISDTEIQIIIKIGTGKSINTYLQAKNLDHGFSSFDFMYLLGMPLIKLIVVAHNLYISLEPL